MDFMASLLRRMGGLTPMWLPRGTAIGNRLLKPLYRKLCGCEWQTVEVWHPIKMKLNPCECVGGNLFFSPQLYDINERECIKRLLPENGVFVDVGANLGVYSLWASMFLSNNGKILAVEADGDTFKSLQENITMNRHACSMILENIGVSDKFEELPFYKNTHGNAGANSFYSTRDSEPSGVLKLAPLISVLKNNKIEEIDFMKIDIEGFELRALKGFFADCLAENKLRLKPKYILIEIEEGPRCLDVEYTDELKQMFEDNGYQVTFNGKNVLYRLIGIE